MKTGRKSLKEEFSIAQRYSDLSERAFKVIRSHLDSKDKKDQEWAVEQLSKGYQKMIPQQVTGEGGGPVQIQWQQQSSFRIVPDDGQSPSTKR